MDWIKVGALIKPFGLKGEMRVYSMTDFAEERFAKGKTVYLKTENRREAFKVATFRIHKDEPLISFEGYQDINLIEKYAKAEIEIKKEDLHKLDEGEYYFFELKGLEVIDQKANPIGTVLRVEEGAANNVLRVQTNQKKEILIPYVPAFIKKVDLTAKRIIIQVIEGLL